MENFIFLLLSLLTWTPAFVMYRMKKKKYILVAFFVFLVIATLIFSFGSSISKTGSVESYAGMAGFLFTMLSFVSLAAGGIIMSIVSWINHHMDSSKSKS